MSNKTVLVISIIAASLLIFIFLFERDTMTTSERMARKGRVFAEFKKEAISKLELKGVSDQKVVMEKVSGPSDIEEKWRITAPKALDADETEIREVLSSLDFLLIDRAVEGADKTKDSKFALETPRIQGSFVQRDKQVTFKIGADAQGEKVYLATSAAPNTVYAVNAEIVEALDKSVNDLRSKKLVNQSLEDAKAVKMTRPLGDVEMSVVDDNWQVKVDDVWILGAKDQAMELVHLAEDLKAKHFIADEAAPGDLSKWGLAPAELTIEVDTEKQGSVSVLVGKACDNEKSERYATVAKSGVVACVNDDFSVVAERPSIRFQENRPGVFTVADVKKIEISSSGKRLEMIKKSDKWRSAKNSVALDADIIEETLKAFTETRATQIDVGDNAVQSLTGSETTVSLTLEDEKEAVTWSLYPQDETHVKLRRGDEKAVLSMPSKLLDKVSPDILAFRSRTLLDGHAENVEKIVIKGPISQTVEKKAGLWRITAPIDAGADSGAVRKLADLMAVLTADRFVAERANPKHGLGNPFAIIEAHIGAGHDHGHHEADEPGDTEQHLAEQHVVLEIGVETPEGKRYARVRGRPVVFVIGDDFEYAIRNPLIARDVLQIDDATVEKITISYKDGSKTFSKRNDVWRSDDMTAFNEDALKRIVTNLNGIKAISAHAFGPPGPAFKTPLMTLTFSYSDGDEKTDTITIGAQSEVENAGYLARKKGLEATMVIPAGIVEEIEAFVSSGGNPAEPQKE